MTHRAALMTARAQPFTVETVSTPRPGPGEVLVAVKAIAINPVDRKQREAGFFVDAYPAILGSDISGTVVEMGSFIPVSTKIKIGDRVTAYANTFYTGAAVRFGAFQEKVVVPIENVAPIPDNLSFLEAATIPMSAVTAWAGWYSMGLPYTTKVRPEEKKGMLVWGASSSVGISAVQSARDMGFIVYATASPRHKALLMSLGASEVLDYNNPDVVSTIVSKAKGNNLNMKYAYFATGKLDPIVEVMSAFGGGMIAQAPALPAHSPDVAGVRVIHIHAPADEGKRKKHFAFVMQDWVAPGLASGRYKAASKPRLLPGGLAAINQGCDVVAQGVSGEKVVFTIS